MEIREKCIELSSISKIKCEENGRVILSLNPQRAKHKKVTVDGCAIDDDGYKCDFLLIENNGKEHYVELKGSDVIHAFKQLKRTIKLLSVVKPKRRFAYVVSSKVPKVGAKVQREKDKFRKDTGTKLQVKNNRMEVKL